MQDSNSLAMQDQIVVVTGAGGGIGSVISHRMAEAGAKVVLADSRNKEETETVATSLPGDGHMVGQAFEEDSES